MNEKPKSIEFASHKGVLFPPYRKVNDVVEIEDTEIRSKNFTFSAWIFLGKYFEETLQWGCIFSKDRSGDGSFQFRFVVNYDKYLSVEGLGIQEYPPGSYWPFPYHRSTALPSSGWSSSLTSKIPISVETWTHVAMIRDGFNFKLFINGELNNQIVTATIVDHANLHPMRVGSRMPPGGGYPDHPLYGEVDAPLWFETAFTDDEVRSLYSTNFSRQSDLKPKIKELLPWLQSIQLEHLNEILEECGATNVASLTYMRPSDFHEIKNISKDDIEKLSQQLYIWRFAKDVQTNVADDEYDYHIFLSHRQITGGDMAQAIKLQLNDMNSKLKIFLDVDDLNNVHNLEQNVIRAKNIVLLLTDGALLRPFVQLEIMTGIKYNKNFVIVIDERSCKLPNKEEMTMLPVEIQNLLKSKIETNSIIPYYREYRFREVAIELIYENILL